MIPKTQRERQIEELAKQYRQKDKRLSWDTCMKKATDATRRFNGFKPCEE